MGEVRAVGNLLLSHFPYVIAAWIFICGLWGATTSKNLVNLCLCVAVIQSSTYVLLLAGGYRSSGIAPIFTGPEPHNKAVDPVVQALMLTDIVVEATVLALLLALVVQIHKRSGKLNPDEFNPMKG